MINGVMVQHLQIERGARDKVRDLRMRQSGHGTPNTPLVDMEDIQVAQYLEQARDRSPGQLYWVSVHLASVCAGLSRHHSAP